MLHYYACIVHIVIQVLLQHHCVDMENCFVMELSIVNKLFILNVFKQSVAIDKAITRMLPTCFIFYGFSESV